MTKPTKPQWKAVYYAEAPITGGRREIGVGHGKSPKKAIRQAQKTPGKDGSRCPLGWRIRLEVAEWQGDDDYSVSLVAFGDNAAEEALAMHKRALRRCG